MPRSVSPDRSSVTAMPSPGSPTGVGGRDLAADAVRLRSLHVAGTPLLLANAWDPPTAGIVESAGFEVVATSSAGVAVANGFEDHGHLPATVAFEVVSRIAATVSVPVTADLEDGYGLAPTELVRRAIEAGACGYNIEDSDHPGDGLLDVGEHADRIAALRGAAVAEGVEMVLNARVDAHLRGRPAAEGLERAARYREAGADCLYPIGLSDLGALREYAAIGPVNVLLRQGGPTLEALAAAGVSRVSLGGGLFRLALDRVRAAAEALVAGDDARIWA